MSDSGPRGPQSAAPSAVAPEDATSAADTASSASGPPPVDRMAKFTYANMIRSLVPLTVICLLLVGWSALKFDGGDPVRTVETESAIRATAETAGYPVLVPQNLPDGWRATSVRTNAGSAQAGDEVTLQIGWYTPAGEYAGFVLTDDVASTALSDVLKGASDDGAQQLGGAPWERHTTSRGETALTRADDTATLLLTGSASDDELAELAIAVAPVPAPTP